MKLSIGATAATILVVVGGCSSSSSDNSDGDGNSGEPDCALGVLFADGEYVERGFVDQADREIGSGWYAACDDTAIDSRGLIFRDDGKRVEVWSLTAAPSSVAIAVEVGAKYAVLLNKELTERRRARIIKKLGLEE